ncbi:MAG: AraC family transcriptional regulator ligand-binding domain-containing protein, partial [Pseudomonadota bacterium]
MAEIQAATGLEEAVLGNPDARVSDDIPFLIWAALMAKNGSDRALGLEAARAASFTALGGFAHGVQFAATLGEALSFLVRMRNHLADRLQVKFFEADGAARVEARHPNDSIDQGRVTEVGTALIARLLRNAIGVNAAPKAVEFAYAPYGPVAEYEDFFGCPVQFERGRTALVYASETLVKPIPTAEPTLFEFV